MIDHTTRMRTALAVFALIPVAWGCQEASPAGAFDGERVLVFSKTAGYRHASIEPGMEALRQFAGKQGIDLVATENADVFRTGELDDYAAVVFLSTTGDVLNDSQQLVLMSYIRSGGGFVGIHSATDTEYDWAWYGQLVGGYFESHPNNPNVREGTLSVVRPEHPSTQGLPHPWIRSDEWYEIRDLQPDLVVLLTINESSYKTPAENPSSDPRPLAWYHEFDGGRSFYTALGHTTESFADPLFLEHVWGGLQYVMAR